MNAWRRPASRAIRAVGYFWLATMLMGMDQFGTEAAGCFRACQYGVKHPEALRRKEKPKEASSKPPAPAWTATATGGGRSFTFSAQQPRRTFTVRVETSIPRERLAEHRLVIEAAAIFPPVTAGSCAQKCCFADGSCTCLGAIGDRGQSLFAAGLFPANLGERVEGAACPSSGPPCKLGGRWEPCTSRRFELERSMKASDWKCDAALGRCVSETPLLVEASDPAGTFYDGVLERNAAGQLRAVPYVEAKRQVRVEFMGRLYGPPLPPGGIEKTPDGLVFAMKVVEP